MLISHNDRVSEIDDDELVGITLNGREAFAVMNALALVRQNSMTDVESCDAIITQLMHALGINVE